MSLKSRTNMAVFAYALGGALSVGRLASARTVYDLVLIGGFSLAEVSIVEGLRRKSEQVEIAASVRNQREQDRLQLADVARSAEEESRRRHVALRQLELEMNLIECESEEDAQLSDLKALTTIATSAILGGYAAGIAHNDGELGGVRSEV